MKLKWTVLPLAVAISLTGCGNEDGYKPAPAPEVKKTALGPGQEAELFPLKKDTQWVYESELKLPSGETKTSDLTFKVTDVTQDGNKTLAEIDIYNDKTLTDRTTWIVGPDGISQTAAGKDKSPFNPPQLAVKFPIKDKETFKQQITGPVSLGQATSQSLTNRVAGWQEVDTAMGRFYALAVESLNVYTDHTKDGDFPVQTANTTYWAPKVGIVRLRQESVELRPKGQISVVQVLRLKSKTPKD